MLLRLSLGSRQSGHWQLSRVFSVGVQVQWFIMLLGLGITMMLTLMINNDFFYQITPLFSVVKVEFKSRGQ